MSLLRVSSRRQTLFGLFRLFRRSAIIADFPYRYVRNRFRNRFYPNWRASSSTRSPRGLSCHNTSTPRWLYLDGSHRFDSPCLRRVRSCCRHHFGASLLDHVGRLHCVPTRLVLHAHGACLPPFMVSNPIRSKGSQRKATWICTSQKRTVGIHVGDKIGSGLFDRSRSGERDGLSSDTRNDTVL